MEFEKKGGFDFASVFDIMTKDYDTLPLGPVTRY